jgi:hypothetical protein
MGHAFPIDLLHTGLLLVPVDCIIHLSYRVRPTISWGFAFTYFLNRHMLRSDGLSLHLSNTYL